MKEKHIVGSESKRILYSELEVYARGKIREHLQDLLEEEVSEWLGREKSERKRSVLEQPGYRNGYGKTRRFTMSLGTLEVRRPRVRDLGERFVSKILPMFRRQTKEVRGLIPELYLHGLASGDFELALRELLGEGAPLSASSIQRLRQMKVRGVKSARLFVGDGNLGLWAAVGEIYPQAKEQLCWNHKMLNVMDAVSKKEQVQAKGHLNAMMYAESRQEALKERKKFEQAFRHNPKAVKTVVDNWERLTTYYDFPREHWKHLRTSNVVESPFSRVRLRTTASRRFKSQVNATCLIWETLMVAEMSFRKLNAPSLVEKVAEGKKYDNGKEIRVAA